MESFFKHLAKFFLRIDSIIKNGLASLLLALNSQLVALFFTILLGVMTILLIWSWAESTIWMRIVFVLLFLIVFLFSASALYFFIQRERRPKAKNISNFDTVQVITDNEAAQKNLFNSFSGTHFEGNFEEFKFFLSLKHLEKSQRLIWVDTNPNNPKQINRQTLLEFLSQLFAGFENLSNKTIVDFCTAYFILGKESKNTSKVNSKNVSDWRLNRSPYLKHISTMISKAIEG